jgi:Carboxypeptidase regulatory-like domain
MKRVVAGVLGLIAASIAAAQTRNASSDTTKASSCSVTGTVVRLAGSVPLKSATVRLQSADDESRSISGVTDVGGQFEIKGIDPGRYRLRVIRDGFVTEEYGQKTPSDPGAVLSLGPGQNLKDLLFRLVPSAIISGRIQDEDSNPLPWVRVSALREAYMRGRRRLVTEVTVVTNDLGEYRLFGLRPGRYFVSATYRPGQRLDPTEEDTGAEGSGKSGYVPTYYPGSPDPAKAIAVSIKTGEEISSMDLLLEPATVYSIRGRVSILGVRRPADGVILMLEPRSTGLTWATGSRQSLVNKPDGSFEISSVLPGAYTLVATWFDEGRRYQARQSLDISGGDAEAIQLTLTTGWNVSGQVMWDPPKASLERNLMVMARNTDTSVPHMTRVPVAANGTFSLRELPEGTYQVSTFGQTQDCYLKSIRFAGMEVSDDEFNVIRGTQATLEVTIGSRGARVQGTVSDVDGLPAAGVWVVLVPDGAHGNEFRRFKQTTTDQAGRFDIRGIAPGDYKMFSWEQVEPNAWEDPDFLKPFEAKAQSVSLQEGDGKSLNLVAIRSAGNEQEKQ